MNEEELKIWVARGLEIERHIILFDHLDQMKDELKAYSTTIYDYNMASNRTNREGFSSVSFS